MSKWTESRRVKTKSISGRGKKKDHQLKVSGSWGRSTPPRGFAPHNQPWKPTIHVHFCVCIVRTTIHQLLKYTFKKRERLASSAKPSLALFQPWSPGGTYPTHSLRHLSFIMLHFSSVHSFSLPRLSVPWRSGFCFFLWWSPVEDSA